MPKLLRARQLHKPDGILPIARSTLFAWIAKGDFPQGMLVTSRCRMWDSDEVVEAIKRMAGSSHARVEVR